MTSEDEDTCLLAYRADAAGGGVLPAPGLVNASDGVERETMF